MSINYSKKFVNNGQILHLLKMVHLKHRYVFLNINFIDISNIIILFMKDNHISDHIHLGIE